MTNEEYIVANTWMALA